MKKILILSLLVLTNWLVAQDAYDIRITHIKSGGTGFTDDILPVGGTDGLLYWDDAGNQFLFNDDLDLGTLGTITLGGGITFLDNAVIPPLNVTARSVEPSAPSAEDVYLDDGTNTASGNPGWRRYTGAVWEDITAAAAGAGGDFSNNGDTAGANRTLGNNDAFDMGFEASGATSIHIEGDGVGSTAGYVGIGTTTPAAELEIEGRLDLDNGGASVFIGSGAGDADDASVNSNVAIGRNALTAAVNSSNNTTVGDLSMQSALTGAVSNSAFGQAALVALTEGDDNIAIGVGSLDTLTTGSDNVAIGNSAMGNAATGATSNVAVGHQALNDVTSGGATSGSVAVGFQALFDSAGGANNIGIGFKSLDANTTGSGNIGIGTNALGGTLTTDNNTAVGNAAMITAAATQGSAFGSSSLAADTGTGNTAVGVSALSSKALGDYNVAIGFASLDAGGTKTNNVAVGAEALGNITTGSDNVALGEHAGRNIAGGAVANTTSGTSVYLGGETEALADGGANEIVIGFGATGIGSNTAQIGNTSIVQANLGTLPFDADDVVGAGQDNFVLTYDDALGVITLEAVVAGSGDFSNNGDTAGANRTLGNNDAFDMGFEASGNVDIHIEGDGVGSTAGFVGIGTTTPSADLEVDGRIGVVGTGESIWLGNGAGDVDDATTNQNIGIGEDALGANTSGSFNVAIGDNALATNVNGDHNIAIGEDALDTLTGSTTDNNIGIGSSAGTAITNGADNLAIGRNALFTTNTGDRNIAIGNFALDANLGTNENVAIGYGALGAAIATRNTAVGDEAGGSITTGTDNTAIGWQALLDSTEGFRNTGVGTSALENNTLGDNNTALGHDALSGNSIGDDNTGIGYFAMGGTGAAATPVGSDNTAVGSQALQGVTGSSNVSVGALSLQAITSGSNNVALGFQAGQFISGGITDNTTSGTSIYIGSGTEASADGNANEIVIGDQLTGNGSNTVTLGNASITDVYLNTLRFDADQTPGAGQDNFVLTFDNGTGVISLEAAAAGGGAFSDAGDPVVLNTTTKEVEIGPTLAGAAKLTVHGDADEPQLFVQGNGTQTNDLVVIEDSAGTDLLTLDNGGLLTSGNYASAVSEPRVAIGGARSPVGDSYGVIHEPTLTMGGGSTHFGVADEPELQGLLSATLYASFFASPENAGSGGPSEITSYLSKPTIGALGTGTVGEYRHFSVDTSLIATDVQPSTQVGLYIDTGLDEAGTNYAIASNTSAPSFLVGNLGVGQGPPSFGLSLTGTAGVREQAAADADVAAYGQIWVKNDTPNTIWFTDDAGTDFQLGVGGGAFSDAGDPVVLNTTTKEVEIGPSLAGAAKLTIHGDADEPQLFIQGNGTQTNDLVVIEDSAGTDLFTLDNVGIITLPPSLFPAVAADGEIKVKLDGMGIGVDTIDFYDGVNVVELVGTLASDTPVTGDVPTFVSGGGGFVDWQTPTGDFTTNGDVAGANRTLGNNDAQDMGFEAGGTTSIHIEGDGVGSTAGFVGIGTTTPQAELEVVGRIDLDDGNTNLAIGPDALVGGPSGARNVGVGSEAGKVISTGQDNTGIGALTLKAVTTGSANTAVGRGSQAATAIGASGNTSVGYGSLLSVTSGDATSSGSVAIGYNALTLNSSGADNVAVGFKALDANTLGGSNVGIGVNALGANVSSNHNTAVGATALAINTAAENTAVGSTALATNLSGTSNSAFGFDALNANSTGSENSAFGTNALSDSTASNNTAFGSGAIGEIVGGGDNTALGFSAGTKITGGVTGNTTSTTSVYLGSSTKANADGGANEIVIGYDATGHGSNTATLGNDSVTEVHMRNFEFDVDQTVGAGQDNYVLTYDDADGQISLEAGSGGLTPAYGIMSAQGGAIQNNIGSTPIISTAWNTDGLSSGTTVSSANDYITVTAGGVYEVDASFGFSGTNGADVGLYIYWYDDSGTAWNDSGFATLRTISGANADGSASVTGILDLDASDRVAIYITTDGATDDVTLEEAQLKVNKIAN